MDGSMRTNRGSRSFNVEFRYSGTRYLVKGSILNDCGTLEDVEVQEAIEYDGLVSETLVPLNQTETDLLMGSESFVEKVQEQIECSG